MKVRNIVRKAAVLGTSTLMGAATLAGAFAYDLGDFPADFILDGMFDGKIIVGERAATADVIGAIDVAASLQAESTTEVDIPGQAGSTSLRSEGFKLETGSDKLELREPIGDVVDTVTENELPGLKSGRITTSEGDTEYFQYLRFKDGANLQEMAVNYVENDDNEMGSWLVVDTDSPFLEWEIQFPEGFESELDGTQLDDMEDKTFNIMGTDFTVVKADVDGDGTDFEMTLMGGSIADTLREGETRTYSIDGIDYEVTLVFVSDPNTGSTECKFSVNGELTQALEEGETDTLSGGLQIGVRDVLVNAREGVASFFLGADKIELTDSNVNDSVNTTGSVEINNENINDGKLIVQGSYPSSTKFEITDIKYQLIMDADRSSELYAPPGSGMRELMRRPESMISDSLDVFYAGLTEPETTPVEFRTKGDDEYQMVFTNIQGREYRFPVLSNENGIWKWGDNDDELVFVEGANAADYVIGDDDWFIVSNDRGADEDKAVTNVLRYEDYDNTDFTLEFTDLSTDNSVSVPIGTDGSGSLVIGGHTYDVNVSGRTLDSPTLSVDLNADGDHGGDQVNITAWGGVIFDLATAVFSGNASTTGVNKTASVGNGRIINSGSATGEEVNMTMRVLDKNFDSATQDGTFVWSINTASNDEVTLTTNQNDYSGPNDNSANTWTKFELDEPSDDLDDWKYGLTDWGIMIREYNPSDSDEPNELFFDIPSEQVSAEVFVTLGAVETSSTGGSGTSTQVNPIAVGMAVLDSAAPAIGSENLIVVGGPCANTVAMELMGSPDDCTEGFTPGKAMIKAWDKGSTVALLVAGYSAEDTQGATRVLAEYGDYSLSGSEVEVVVADLNSITVQAPTMDEPEMDDEADDAGDDAGDDAE